MNLDLSGEKSTRKSLPAKATRWVFTTDRKWDSLYFSGRVILRKWMISFSFIGYHLIIGRNIPGGEVGFSGRGDSNPLQKLGRLLCYRYTTPALKVSLSRILSLSNNFKILRKHPFRLEDSIGLLHTPVEIVNPHEKWWEGMSRRKNLFTYFL